MKIEIVQTNAEQPWHARMRGDNGEPVWFTENYGKRSDAIHAVDLAARTFGVRGLSSTSGPPGNTSLVFTHGQFGGIPSQIQFALIDVDER